MKKISFFGGVVVIAAALTGCSSPTKEYHYSAIHYPSGGVTTIYADQTVDSIHFTAFDSWTLTCATVWARVSSVAAEKQGSVPEGYFVQPTVPVYFDVNTTGAERTAQFNLSSYEAVLSAFYKQVPRHNITRPKKLNTEGVFVQDACNKNEKTDSITFEAYSAWKVTLEPAEAVAWLTLPATVSGAKGKQVIKYTVAAWDVENDTTRTATLVVSGNEPSVANITTRISVSQHK